MSGPFFVPRFRRFIRGAEPELTGSGQVVSVLCSLRERERQLPQPLQKDPIAAHDGKPRGPERV